ncbi:hypothetical protein ACROYT_G028551 [Oculina patagonica]
MDSLHSPTDSHSIHSLHEGFVELEELVSCDNELVWKERARWIKLEEDVEESADRWGKPHIPCLTYRSLREVETNLQNGVFLLDLQRDNLPSICEAIIDEIKLLKKLGDEECNAVKTVLLTRHEHQHQNKVGKHRAKNIARRLSRIMPQGQRPRQPTATHDALLQIFSEDAPIPRTKHEDASRWLVSKANQHCCHLLKEMLTQVNQQQDFNVTVNNYHSADDNVEQLKDHNERSDIRGKIPENAQATTVLVGAHNDLSCIISAFIRLASGCDLGNFAEVRIPVRFMFVLLGPGDDTMDYHEVGRSISTLMSDKIFLESAYQAKNSAASRLIKNEIKLLKTSNEVFLSIETEAEENVDFLPATLKTFLEGILVGKDNVKLASIGQAIVQMARPRVILAPLQVGLAVQLHHNFASRFLIDTLHRHGFFSSYQEVQLFNKNAALNQGTDMPDYDGEFAQYIADNVDHNLRILDGNDTFHGMGMICIITPGTNRKRSVPRRKLSPQDISAAGNVGLRPPSEPRQSQVEIKYNDVVVAREVDPQRIWTYFGRRFCCLAPHAQHGLE